MTHVPFNAARLESVTLLLWLCAMGCTYGEEKQLNPASAASPGAKPTARAGNAIEKSLLRYDGHDYRVTKGEIIGTIGDPYWCDKYNMGHGKSLSWLIEFRTIAERNSLGPVLEIGAFQFEPDHWHELAGYKTQWKQAIDEKTGNGRATLFVRDHQWVANGRVEIAARKGTGFRVIASGENDEGKSFSMDAFAEFKGIYVRGSEHDTAETILSRLQDRISARNLAGTPFMLAGEYSSGVKMGESFFSPISD